jgi:tRNA 2-thiocytidine biosynthesis protein TtcA
MVRALATGKKLERQLLHLVGKAAGDFGMFRDGDRVAVALSGGKDSFTLLRLLTLLSRSAPVRFEVAALTVHNGSEHFQAEILGEYLASEGIPFHLERTHLARIVEEKARPGTPYCALCARLRRGALYGAAQRLGFNKVALGHHLDDAAETLLMNLFFVGCLKSMPPKLRAENGRVAVVRPLYYVPEPMIRDYARERAFPVIDCGCWLCGEHDDERARMKRLIADVAGRYGQVRQSVRSALGNVMPRYLADPKRHDFELEDVPPTTPPYHPTEGRSDA